MKTEDKNLNECDDSSSSQNTYSSLPHEQEQSNKTSISVGSFSKGQASTSSDEMPTVSSDMPGDKAEKRSEFSQETVEAAKEAVLGPEGEAIDHTSTNTISSNDLNLPDIKEKLNPILPNDSQSSTPQNIFDSPMLSEGSYSKLSLTSSSSPVLALTSWLGGGSHSELRAQSAAPSMESYISVAESDASSELKSTSHGSTAPNEYLSINSGLLIEMDDSGYGGGPCSAGATAVLDFLAEVLSDFVTEQLKATPIIENILESVPIYIDAESVLVFQGLCLSRLMNFVERRLLRDDEENDKKLDKSRWSLNLDALCWMIVDRVYMGAFPQPAGVLRTLEFLLSMLQLANKDGRIEEAPAAGKLLLSITRGSRQLDGYIYAILKNMNRMILYCFLPLFLITIGEDDLIVRLSLQNETKKRLFYNSSLEDTGVDISTVLQLLVAHRRIIFCPSNIDTDLNCCLCINLVFLLFDQRQNVQNMAVDILKYLLLHRRAALEELLVSKRNQGPHVDVLHGGFDKLLTGDLSTFFKWFHSSEQDINKVLEQCGSIMWMQYITGSAKFPGVRIKGMDGRRKREINRKTRDSSKLDFRHWEQINERRIALEVVRDAMSTELRVVRQDKYGWVLHAESEWQTHLQQLVHERGIFPTRKTVTDEDPDWQLCPIEGPFRMRKKLERCKLKIDTIQNVLSGKFELGVPELSKEKIENEPNASDTDSEYFFNVLTENVKNESFGSELYDESVFKESDDARDAASSRTGWNDDRDSSIYEASLQSGAEFGVKTNELNIPTEESIPEKSDSESPMQPAAVRTEEVKLMEEKSDKDLNDNGEYLVRPYLEPLEKIKHRYNCERVVGLDKHDGIFLIGELCLYVIENFYIDESGCICEKEGEDELSVIDQALGVKKDFSCSMDSHSKSTSSWGASMKSYVGGRAWAYNGGAWGKEKIRSSGNVPHLWRMWKLNSVHEMLKRDYQLRPVAIEVFSMDGCNDLLVFHKKEREEVFKNLVAMNLPRNSLYATCFIFDNIFQFILFLLIFSSDSITFYCLLVLLVARMNCILSLHYNHNLRRLASILGSDTHFDTLFVDVILDVLILHILIHILLLYASHNSKHT